LRRRPSARVWSTAPEGATTTWPCKSLSQSGEAWLTECTQLPRSVRFASCFIYAPRGVGLLSAVARLVCQRVKAGDPLWVPRYAACAADRWMRAGQLLRIFERDALLVPVPGSTPGSAPWAAWQLAVTFRALGLAQGVWTGLRRRYPIRKSATALLGERPTVWQHYSSMAVGAMPNPAPRKVVLVDDVVTKGRTLLAAAACLRAQLPHADIRAVALIRTLGFIRGVDTARLVEPCEGFVFWRGGDARREP
jgi:adenine/guanine phosphoribosyltransferase-like PRPP-binding protein